MTYLPEKDVFLIVQDFGKGKEEKIIMEKAKPMPPHPHPGPDPRKNVPKGLYVFGVRPHDIGCQRAMARLCPDVRGKGKACKDCLHSHVQQLSHICAGTGSAEK